MKRPDPKLLVQPAPLLKQPLTTSMAMRDVLIALAPATLAGVWMFGLGALLILLASIAGAVATEWVLLPDDERRAQLANGSAIVTGLLLGLTLPPALPLWMAFLGGVVSIGLGKIIWGGLGYNLFNPALVGRAFLLAAFPVAMTTWSAQTGPTGFFEVAASNLAAPFMHIDFDGVSSATPLNLMKFQHQSTALWDLMIGRTSGCIGETSGLLLILGGLFLAFRRDLDWRIPASILIAVAAFTSLLVLIDAERYPGPLFSVFSGSLLIGAFYMASDPVTSPLTPKGAWIFGTGVGLLVVLIRVFGGFPEGVMYAILLMNAATPLIDRYTQPRVFGKGLKSPRGGHE
ncbi:RnfABCDGE type electron transport complex subunit D [Thiocystis violacea]|uniref:RnfABCDGE type electron transport complex subunit D n=1 Tax=Thiocystis violacea TaxID=13725 RepID=UPI00190760CE|nr:RnfABCDGE type electron transport complex subunit D [Thiocystis violacea]MBK1723975.1 electron transporter RnfD [Thiocystis violacea]